jgi:ribonuclease P protein component
VLARVHRIVDGEQLRQVSRRGSRKATEYFVVAQIATTSGVPGRFGFVVSKQVGGAVVRNQVKRRLRALAQAELLGGFTERDVVVRALPAAGSASYDELARAWSGVFSQ